MNDFDFPQCEDLPRQYCPICFEELEVCDCRPKEKPPQDDIEDGYLDELPF